MKKATLLKQPHLEANLLLSDRRDVPANVPHWNSGIGLEANRYHILGVNETSRWTLNGGITHDDLHGSGSMDGHQIGIPKNPIPLGGLIVLIWHHQADGTAIAEIHDFAGNYNAIEFTTGAHGGSIWFVIADLPGTYGDNSGHCSIILHK